MASWQSQFIKFAIRARQVAQGQLRREVWTESTSVTAFREMCEQGARQAKMPVGVEAVPVTIDGLPEGLKAEWLMPTDGCPAPKVEDAVIFYTHGGGYISGSCSDHRALVGKLVAASGVKLLLFEYRLAPEHPFPAAMEDTLTAYRWLLRQVDPGTRVLIAGESAGGGLCLAALLAFRDLGLPQPLACISISPWTDLALNGKPNQVKMSIEPVNMSAVCCKHYAANADPTHPWISPLYGDLRGLPPLWMSVGDEEGMLDDSLRFYEKARAAGVDVHLTVGRGQVHCYPLLPDFIPESKAAMDEIAVFIQTHLQTAAVAV